MNNKDIKKLLKEKADNIEIKDFSDKILSETHHNVVADNEIYAEKTKKSRKKLTISLISSIATACLVLVFVVIGVTNFLPVNNNITVVKEKTQQVFSREILALGNLVSNINTAPTEFSSSDNNISASTFNKNEISFVKNANHNTVINQNYENSEEKEDDSSEDSEENNILTQEEMEKIAENVNYYLLTGNAFMEKQNIIVNDIENTDINYKNYARKITVKYKDVQSFEREYVFYYNSEKQENTEKIKGKFLIDHKNYDMEGEIKTKSDEVEMELKIIFAKNSYVSIENETEINENEYEYKYYKDGTLKTGVSMEVSNENGEKELEIKVTENGTIQEYQFEYKSETIECTYVSGNVETEILIYIHDEFYLYKFENGEINLPKTKINIYNKMTNF